MTNPLVVTVIEMVVCCELASENVALHVPAFVPTAVNVADGPLALAGVIVAIDEQVLVCENEPL